MLRTPGESDGQSSDGCYAFRVRSSVFFTIAILSGCSSLRHQPLGTEADAGALPVSAAPDSRVESAEPSLDDRPDAHAPGESLRDAGAEEAGRDREGPAAPPWSSSASGRR